MAYLRYMKLVTKYQISAINSCWEKCDEKYLGTNGRTEIKQYTPLRWSGGIIKYCASNINFLSTFYFRNIELVLLLERVDKLINNIILFPNISVISLFQSIFQTELHHNNSSMLNKLRFHCWWQKFNSQNVVKTGLIIFIICKLFLKKTDK